MELKREHWRRGWWRRQALVDIESAPLPYHLILQYYWECLGDEVQSRKLSSCFKASSPNMQQWSTLALVPGTCEVVDPLTDKSSNPEHRSFTACTLYKYTALYGDATCTLSPHRTQLLHSSRQVPQPTYGSKWVGEPG